MREWVEPIAKYVLYAVIAVCILDWALASHRETARLARECRRLRAQIAHIRKGNIRREKVRKALASDPFYVERVFRERYGYYRTNEPGPTETDEFARASRVGGADHPGY